MPLAKAGAKERVCGDRAKSGTHQWLLMMRAVVAVPPRQEQRQEKLVVAKGAFVPHLCSVRADFGGSGTRDAHRDLGQPSRHRQGSGNGNKVTSDARCGHPSSLARSNLSTGLREHWLWFWNWCCRGGQTCGAFQGRCSTWELLLFSLSCSCRHTMNFCLVTLDLFEHQKQQPKQVFK